MSPLLLLLLSAGCLAAVTGALLNYFGKGRWVLLGMSLVLVLFAAADAVYLGLAASSSDDLTGVHRVLLALAAVGVLGLVAAVLDLTGRRTVRPLVLSLVVVVGAAAGGLVTAAVTDSSPHLGLDLQGGISVVLEPTSPAGDQELDQAVAIIRNRVDGLGVAEPEITRQGDAIIVQIPGVDNREQVLDLIGTTAELRFRPVLQQADAATFLGDEGGEAAGDEEVPAGEEQGSDAGEDAAAEDPAAEDAGQAEDPEAEEGPEPPEAAGQLTPPGEDAPGREVTLPGKDEEVVYILGPTPCVGGESDPAQAEEDGGPVGDDYCRDGNLATGRVVESAQAGINQTGSAWEVRLTMRSGEEGIDTFNQVAATCNSGLPTCPTSQLAIVLDSEVQSAPAISEPSYQRDQIVISGGSADGQSSGFTEQEAKDLALVLRYGSLPVELERQSVETVSATLGEDSLRAGIVAGLVGFALVALYMILYYRLLGAVAITGLALWGALMYVVIAWLGVNRGLALTLAGVTGIIISVGVTVDSYVVYFERLKDEVKMGRTLRSSAERAFNQSFRTIVAANAATFIGAAVLWRLTAGAVRGFAFYLGLSTVLGVMVTWTYTRPVVRLLSRSRRLGEARGVGIASGLAAPGPQPASRPQPAVEGSGR